MRFERGKKHIEELKILYKLKQKPYFSKFNPTLHLNKKKKKKPLEIWVRRARYKRFFSLHV